MKRNTIQRQLTLEAVNKLSSHATAEEIYGFVSEEHPNISRATVYRNLNELAESGEIQKIEVPCGADRFDHTLCNHYHARCLKCGKIFDVDMDFLGDLTSSIKDAHGFAFCGYDLMFKGVCGECLEKEH